MAAVMDDGDGLESLHERGMTAQYAPPSAFQQLDYIPFISIISGIARAALGGLMIISGVVTLVPEIIYDMIKSTNHELLLVKGCSHMARGIIALFPFIGNGALYLYDRSRVVTVHRG